MYLTLAQYEVVQFHMGALAFLRGLEWAAKAVQGDQRFFFTALIL